jgi:hypothetical protein
VTVETLARKEDKMGDSTTTEDDNGVPMAGSIGVPTGAAAYVRIPVPGTNGLAIELSPRGHVPAGGSTSTLFIQDASGKRHLRLDYGYNKTTGTIDYHWNQKGVHDNFGIKNHQPAGAGGKALYNGARYFKWAGRTIGVVGAAADVYSIVVADKPLRRATEVAGGWAGAWAGVKLGGAAGAAGGSFVAPGPGTAVGGVIGGGIIGYWGGSKIAGAVYGWDEDTIFNKVPEVPASAVEGR